MYFRTLSGRLIHIFDVYINNSATVQWNCQYSGTVSCLLETETEKVLTASDVRQNSCNEHLLHLSQISNKSVECFVVLFLNNCVLFELLFVKPFPCRNSPLLVQVVLIIEASRLYSDTPHPVRILWTKDQPDSVKT